MKTGIDIIETERFKDLEKSKLEKIFTKNEIEYCNNFSNSYIHFAGHFCAKEALVKALKIGFREGLSPLDIEVLHDDNGSPYINKSKELIELIGNKEIDVNISHTKNNAIAICILY